MTTLTPLHPSPLSEILTCEELSTLHDDIKSKLSQSINEFKSQLHNAKTTLQQEKVTYSHHLHDLDTDLREKQEKLESLKASIETDQNEINELKSENSKLTQLTKTLEKTNAEIIENQSKLEHKIGNLENQNQELLVLVEKRNSEITKLTTDVDTITKQLEKSNTAKIEALQKIDELISREIEVGYREKQTARSLEYSNSQINLLQAELDQKSALLLQCSRDSSLKYIQLQTELTEKIEQARLVQIKLENLQNLHDSDQTHLNNLTEKLRNEVNLRSKIEENYRVEISSLKRVLQLYKESSEDSNKKLEELEDAVQNLQDLLKESTDKYGELEERFKKSSIQFQEEIEARDNEIGKLKLELKTANEVLDSIQKHGMTDEMIQSLSPAAAAASSMLRESKSITEIFSKYQEVQQELGRVKLENLKLNGYLRELLEETEARAPLLQKQKQDYERSVQTVEILSTQMEVMMNENSRSKTEVVELKKNYQTIERENHRLKGQIEDLTRQVRVFLGEEEREVLANNAAGVIAANLTTFRSIEELQKQNLKLLTVVRELSEEKEKNERDVEDRSMGEIRASFQSALAELDNLKQIRLRQDAQIAEINQQRDTLTALLKNRDVVKSDLNVEKLKQTEHSLAQIKEDFESYKKETRENTRLLNESNEKLRDEVLRMRTENSRLAGQIDYNNERTKIYNKNLEQLKKQCDLLEERNKSLNGVIGKHEGSLEIMKSDLQQTHHALSKAEITIATLTNERNLLRETKNKLQLEKEMLQRHEKMSNMLQTNLEEIKNNLELSSAASRIKLENELDSLKNENQILKRRIENESEKSNEFVKSLENKLETFKNKLKSEEEANGKLRNELTESQTKLNQISNELNSLKSATTETEIPQNFDNLEFIGLKSELESVRNQLDIAKQNCEEYRNLSIVLEEQMNITKETNDSMHKEFQLKLSEKEELIAANEIKLINLNKEFESFKSVSTGKIEEFRVRNESQAELIKKLTNEADSKNSQLNELASRIEKISQDLSAEVQSKEDLREEYEKQIMHRAEMTKELLSLKENYQQLQKSHEQQEQKYNDLNQLLNNKTNELNIIQENHEKSENAFKVENYELRETITKLEQQLVVSLSTHGQQGGVVVDETEKSNEQWLQLIRYLRREKEIAVSKMEMAVAQSERLESQLKAVEAKVEELKIESGKRGEVDVELMTSVKQGELMRKVETLSALGDSNRLLRLETNQLKTQLAELQSQLNQITQSQISPLQQQVSELQSLNEHLQIQNNSLQESSQRWQKRANELIEKTNKVNPEEMKKIQSDNEVLLKKTEELEKNLEKMKADADKFEKLFKVNRDNLVAVRGELQFGVAEKSKFEAECKKLNEENSRTRDECDSIKSSLLETKKTLQLKEKEIEKLNSDLEKLETSLEEHKNTVKQVKNIARKYKKQYEDSLEAPPPAPPTDSTGSAELTQLQQNHTNTLTQLHEQTSKLFQTSLENDSLKKELSELKQRLSLIEKTFQQKTAPPDQEDKLTASIRPMAIEKQKLIVVQPQTIVPVAPVSQAQVSTSTPEFSYQRAVVQPVPQQTIEDVEVEVLLPNEVSSSHVNSELQPRDDSEASSSKRSREADEDEEDEDDEERKKQRTENENEEVDEDEVDNENEEEEEEEEDNQPDTQSEQRNISSSNADASIVPSTPTLFLPRNRNEGFSEVARFTFNNEVQEMEENATRSVPGTPLPTDEEETEIVGEVPSSSTTGEVRSRPTPIVWDQPTSSGGGGVVRGAAFGAPRLQRVRMMRPQISSTNVPQRGQSARRSRPSGGAGGMRFYRGGGV